MADLQHDIEKYLRGELTPAEMHALERKALNDPFLADALEGASQVLPEDFGDDLNLLQASLKGRIDQSNTKIIPMWAWTVRIAAGLLVVIVSGFIVFNLLKEKNSTPLAVNDTESAPKSSPPQQQPAGDSASDNTSASVKQEDKHDQFSLAKPEEEKIILQDQVAQPKENKADEVKSTIAEVTKGEPVVSSTDNAASEAPVDLQEVQEQLQANEPVAVAPMQAPMKDIAAEKEEYKERAKAKTDASGATLDKKAALSETRKFANANTNVQVIRGQVTSEDGVGLPGVNVIIKGSNTGTVTDAEGYYQVSTTESSKELVFSFIGMQSKEAEATSDVLDVQLENDVSQLSEVVVVGYGADNVQEEDRSTVEFAAPKGGRAAYKKYLETSMRYPEEALQNEIEGKVTIQFTVETSGQITDFKVLKGLGYGCDEEVIRLIRNGPKWAPTKRDDEAVKDRVKVRLRFRLPKK
ncbi:MAG TPA: TonB family protein [Ohtaekwangia sp.]|uniref:energy transducer TonB n=1 Tax=Ohtaekwangia sp. TaxID=2066019 RepID=UPI002F93B543